jgi:thiol-disulfide isomerase/thioredoxin
MRYSTFFSSLIFVLVLTLLSAGTVSAGGRSEDDTEEAVSASLSSDPLDDDQRAEIQEILAGFDIQTFRSRITAIDFTLEELSGETLSMSDLTGNFVFLNFWATWCPPCREEMPSMEVLHQEMEGAPFRMVAVNVREDRQTVEPFIEEFGYSYPVILDRDGRLSTNYGVRGIPTTYFIGPDGTVLGMLVGTRYWDEEDVMDGIRRITEIVANR